MHFNIQLQQNTSVFFNVLVGRSDSAETRQRKRTRECLMEKMGGFMDKQYPTKPLLAFDVADDSANTHRVRLTHHVT